METGHGGRFEELDVLRGAAALVVVLSHYSTHCVRYFGAGPFGVHLPTIYGFHAVQLFFMISGFVIYFTLERSATWKDFAFSRVTRLYPAYWTALTLMVVLETVVFRQPFWLGGYIANMTMFQEFLGFNNLDNVFWSLTVEVAFYVIMGLLFAGGLASRIELVSGIWLVLAGLWSAVVQYLGIVLPASLPRLLILRYVPFFVAGIVFYLVRRRGPTAARIALLAAALVVAAMIDGVWDADEAAVRWSDVLHRLGVAVVLFGLFAAAVAGRLRFAISPATLWFGTLSYSLYLSHRNLGYRTLFRLHDRGVAISTSFLLTLAGAMVLAVALTYAVERPAMRVLRRWYRTRPGPVAAGP
ncbi:MAG TPA: acyltransferase [Candidatus Nitrosotalea sp.]|jgi:peptidoglycan/LPS O-acetylase OafA/YrhL|nr:acyltransferase [Candidatus Nitrosotalea sp.]